MRSTRVLNQLLMKFTNHQFLKFQFTRFLLTGLLNTLATYLVYVVGVLFLDYRIAFTVSYVIGIIFSYFLNSALVFDTIFNIKTATLYIIIYITQYLIGMLLLYCLVTTFNISQLLAPWVVLCVIVPFTYMLMRVVFKDTYAHQSM